MSNTLRQRVDSGHPTVPLYVYKEELPAISEELRQKMERFNELHLISSTWRGGVDGQRKISENHIEEVRALRDEIAVEVADLMSGMHRSILSHSDAEPSEMFGCGADSHVYETPLMGYLYKYSVPALTAEPEHIEYLQKKYVLLQRLLGGHIPKSAFVYGERLPGFKRRSPEQAFTPKRHCITIQQRVQGKTFKAMTPKERMQPACVRALRIAHANYVFAKQSVREAGKACNLPGNTVDVRLDIGDLSRRMGHKEQLDESLIQSFGSPNVMYDPMERKVYFIDFGTGKWDENKERVYQHLLETEESVAN